MNHPWLSKSRIQSGRQCHKRLWLELHEPKAWRWTTSSQVRLDEGTRFGYLARDLLGGGVLAGTAAAFGLSEEEALRAITLDAARVLGIDQRYGSLSIGKSATIFVSSGNALDMRTNNVTHAFIDGRQLDLDDHQKKLYRQYERRYAEP